MGNFIPNLLHKEKKRRAKCLAAVCFTIIKKCMQIEGGTRCSTEHLETDKNYIPSTSGEREINIGVIQILIKYRHVCLGAGGHSYSASTVQPLKQVKYSHHAIATDIPKSHLQK